MSTTKLSLALSALIACDTESVPIESEQFRNVQGWDEVVCTDVKCYAHSPSADELWHPVVSWCDLQGMVAVGRLVPTENGWFNSCDYNGHPESFSDSMCFYTSQTSIVCYGGHDGWYTKVEPACASNEYDAQAWLAVGCDPDDQVGYTTYDSVLQKQPWVGDVARAVDTNDAFYVIPECALPSDLDLAPDPFGCEG
jgi:hypothetical protein